LIRHEVEIHCSGLALEPLEPWLTESGVIMCQAFVDVWVATGEPAVDQMGACVRHGGDGCGRAKAGAQAAIVSPPRALAVPQVLRPQAQGSRRAVDHVAGAAGEPCAPADPVVRTSAKPRGDVCVALPPAHLQADLGHAGVGRAHLEAVAAGQVDATDAGAWGVESTVRLVASGVLRPTRRGGQRRGCALDLPGNGEEVGLELGVARGDVLLVTCVALACRTQMTEPRVSPVALPTCGEGVGASVDAVICEGGEPGRVACAGPERAAHGQARHAAEVTDDLGEVDVHGGEGLVPVLDAGGRSADEGSALAPGGPSHPEVIGGLARAGEPPDGVEGLAPRAVGEIGVAAGPVVGVAGGDHVDGHTARCQDVEEGEPVHPRAFHDHGLEVAGVEPGGQGLEVGRNARPPAPGLWRASRGQGAGGLGTAHSAAGGLAMQRRQSSGRFRRPWAWSLICAGAGHRRPVGGRRMP